MSAPLSLSLCAMLLVSVFVGSAPGAASAGGTNAIAMEAERYFKCPSGYRFRATSDAAHCKKAGYYELTDLMPCKNEMGIGLFARTDHVGRKDMCAGTNPITGEIAVERGCRLGFAKRIVTGTNQCRKYHPGDIVAPSVQVNR